MELTFAHPFRMLMLECFFISVSVCAVILAVNKYFPNFGSRPGDLSAVQSMHSQPTPRLGGLGIFIAVVAAAFLPHAPDAAPFGKFAIGISVLFLVGVLEDFGVHVTPIGRLVAAISSSLLIMYSFGFWLSDVGMPSIDFLIKYAAVGVPFTIFLTVGVTNGFNLIDGVNGLAGLAGIVGAMSLGLIAHNAGLVGMSQFAALLAIAISGYWIINFPFGLIFLGDGGAYIIGMTLSWLGVAIIMEAPDVSAWAILLALFWPTADLSLAIWRRSSQTKSTMAPDRLHVHQLVMRALKINVFGKRKSQAANPMTTVVLFPYLAVPPASAVIFWNQQLMTFGLVVLFSILFFLFYIKLLSMVKSKRRRPH